MNTGDAAAAGQTKYMNRINTVIFDMDGTVLNTLDDLTDSVNYVLSRFGFPMRDGSEYRKFFGNGIGYALRLAAPEGTPEEVIDEMLPIFREHYGIHCMDKTAPYEASGIRRKPAADMVLTALDELGSSVTEAVYVGDSEVDLQTAQNAGLPCISVLWGFRDRDFLIENGATVFAGTPRDVLSILQGGSGSAVHRESKEEQHEDLR